MNLKFTILLISLAVSVLSQSPAPVPIPTLDLTKITGTWYVVMQYDPYFNNSKTNDITCWSWTFTNTNGVISLFDTYLEGQFNYTAGTNYTFLNNGKSVWQDNLDESVLVWLNVDPIGYSWALIGFQDLQLAMLISRNPSVSQTLIGTELAFLKAEKYHSNSTNYYVINNSKC